MVEREPSVDGLGKHAIAVVEEENEEENDESYESKLYARPDLRSESVNED